MSFTHFPVDAALAVVTSTFGARVDPITGKPAGHNGIDFGVPVGTPVTAVGPGVVESTFSEPDGGGNVIFVRQDNGLRTAYLHLSSFACKKDDRVTGGQVIGFSGSTGRSTGPHLHFEVRQVASPKDIRFDPVDFMPGPLRKRDGTVLAPKAGMGLGAFVLLGASVFFLARRRGWI